MLRVVLILFLALAACRPDETVSGQTAAEDVWRLAALADHPVTARITIRFPEEGLISGDAPCNSYTAAQTAPLPWIDIGPIAVTRRACPDLALESRYLTLLEEMAFAEILGDTLLLTSETGVALTFVRTPSR